jgi:DNA-binding GntR family transcriptional regulator
MTLSAYIRDDLKARILGGTLAGRVTLRDLSERYGVSLTPVREAVEALVREKVIEKEESGRLSIPETPRRAARPGVGAPALRDCHQEIARDILRRSLRGEARFLREEATAEARGVGRTVLRHIFARLAGAGMLEHVPRRGWRVRPFREEDMEAYLEVRELLELKALELAQPRLMKEDLERILERNHSGGGREPARVDTELHPYLLDRCGNRFIQDFFQRHGAYFTTLFYYAVHGPATAPAMARQHREILGALIRRSWEKAKALLSQHIRDQAPAVRKMMSHLAKLPVEKWPAIEAVGSSRTSAP